MFNVVLVEPEIPPNTGNIGRLCLATQSTLHLVRPFGFSLDHRQLRRAGLDYWHEVPLQLWHSFDALQRSQSDEARYFFLTTKTQFPYYRVNFRKNDLFVFGRETKGLPHKLLAANTDNCITIPMHGTRSLNLATAVAIVLFEAVRQQHL